MVTATVTCEPTISLAIVLNRQEAICLRALVQNAPNNIEEESPEMYAVREAIFKALKQAGVQ